MASSADSGARGRELPNVLIIMTDQQKATASHLYGNQFCHTDGMERLARRGPGFRRFGKMLRVGGIGMHRAVFVRRSLRSRRIGRLPTCSTRHAPVRFATHRGNLQARKAGLNSESFVANKKRRFFLNGDRTSSRRCFDHAGDCSPRAQANTAKA